MVTEWEKYKFIFVSILLGYLRHLRNSYFDDVIDIFKWNISIAYGILWTAINSAQTKHIQHTFSV